MEAGRAFREATWLKACNGGGCVEVAPQNDVIAVRDSVDGEDGPVLTLSRATWADFLEAVKAGRFDHI